jgi:glycine/D-amino acid oxidase-like deaminating enzyme
MTVSTFAAAGSTLASRKSVVIGGGFVGLSSAIHLQRIGREVTLVDRAAAGSAAAASYGNAGTMAAYACVPVNSPSLFRKLPGMLMDEGSPLSIKPTPYLASMIPWAALFAWNCRPAAVERTAAGLGALLSRAESGYEPVWEQAGVDVDMPMGAHASSPEQAKLPYATRKSQGHLFLMKSEAAMKDSQASAALRARHITGLRAEVLTQQEVLALEPALSPDSCAGGAWFFPDGWFLNEPGALLRALADGFKRSGGEVRTGQAAVTIRGGGGSGGGASVELEDGTILEADEVVIAAGAHSAGLVTRSLGEWCPLDSERGYHVAFEPGSERILSRGVTDASSGWIATPMAGGLRVAGKVELGGVQAPPTPARWDRIEAEAQSVIDGVGSRVSNSDWLGFRPTMPDSLPVIGRSSTLPCVYYAFGHQHVGWTLGGITGQLIAELVQGVQPSVDLEAYSLDRFRPWAAGGSPASKKQLGHVGSGAQTEGMGERVVPRRALSSLSSGSSSDRLADLLSTTRPGHSIVWMAPCAQTFKSATAASTGASELVFPDASPTADFFHGADVPDRPTTLVVSAQTVSRQFMEAWRNCCLREDPLVLVRRGTSLGSIDIDAAKELGIEVVNTPGVNSPHVARFVVETLGLSEPVAGATSGAIKAVVIGSGSVGQVVIDSMRRVGVEPTVVDRSPDSIPLAEALRGATHVAVCAATSSEPILTSEHVAELFVGEERPISIVSVSRPEAFSLEAIMMIAQRGKEQVQLRFDYGDSILAPTRDQVNHDGVKENITWSSKAMASEACKQDMDEAVLSLLATTKALIEK